MLSLEDEAMLRKISQEMGDRSMKAAEAKEYTEVACEHLAMRSLDPGETRSRSTG